MHVVATAGHVDHGKSTLVRALTGMEPDRLEEERRRGLSIQLGYVWTRLSEGSEGSGGPGGPDGPALPDGGEVAFVDVPGHERFVATMLAGVGPVPAVLFVVAADDPWMPQAAEHLAALDALGLRHGVLAVTRSDLADPAPAMDRARHELDRTSLAGCPAVAVSGRTGAGLDDLREALVSMLATLPVPDPAADVRLWVDRRFHVRGTGTVVTGTLPAGTVRTGDTLQVVGQAGAATVRVRGVECLGAPRPVARGVARVALDLGGKAPEEADRGSVLCTPGAFELTTVVDVRLTRVGAVPERPLMHVGAASVGVRARPLAEDLVRLTLDRALPLRVGDRALLRDPGSRDLWGVTVLDPAPPPLLRRGAAAARAKELTAADGTLAGELGRRGLARRSSLVRLGFSGDPPPGAVTAGDWLLSAGRARELGEQLARLAAQGPDGVSLPAAARALDVPRELLGPMVRPPLRTENGRVVTGTGSGLPKRLPERLLDAAATIREDLAEAPFAAPDGNRLRELGLDRRDLAVLAAAGQLLRLDETTVLLPGTDDRAVAVLAGLPQPFTVSDARAALSSTRRVVLPLLAHLDRTGRTQRLTDDRRAVRQA
jgi:selenocysteine-specific elongation factor